MQSILEMIITEEKMIKGGNMNKIEKTQKKKKSRIFNS